MAALTSLGVCSATGRPFSAAFTTAIPLAWAVPMTVRRLCWAKTRSTATASGWNSAIAAAMPSETPSSRAGSSASGEVRITPTCTSTTRRSGNTSTMPTPQRVSPGSIPSTRSAPPAICSVLGVELGLHVGRDVEVAEDVLHVVAVFECVDDAQHLLRRLEVDLDLEARHELGLSRVVIEPGVDERGARGDQLARVGDDLEAAAV